MVPTSKVLRTGRPARVGHADVRRLESATRALRARDYRNGGGGCRRTVLSRLAWGHELLRGPAFDTVRDRLLVAVADLHNLAGWISFDTGHTRRALGHFGVGLELAGQCGHRALAANLRYRLGRVHLHHHDSNRALTELSRSWAEAQRAGESRAAAIASVNLAWAHGMRGELGEAVRLLGRGQEELAAARGPAAPWEVFFGPTDLAAMVGTVYTELATRGNPYCVHHAISALATAVRDYDERMRRSQVLCLTMLALTYLLDGDRDGAATLAIKTADHADGLTSTRVIDRMRPLLTHLGRHRDHQSLAEATERIRRLSTAAAS